MGRKANPDRAKWAYLCHLAFLAMMRESVDGKVTADDYYDQIRKLEVEPTAAKVNCGNLFKSYRQAGYLVGAKECVTSRRNDGKTIRVWRVTGKPLPKT